MSGDWREGPALRWGAWYGEEEVRIPVRTAWDVTCVEMTGADPLEPARAATLAREAVERRFAPGSLAGKTIALAFDDLARPTPASVFVPAALEALEGRGASPASIRLIAATGSHRPLTRIDFARKLGEGVVSRYAVYNHHPYENLTDLGESARGTPVRVNADFTGADVRIVAGCVLPHPYMGWGGGAKMVLPGLSGIDSLAANHRSVLRGLTGGLLTLEGNEARADAEEVAARIGIDLALQAVVDDRRRLAALFTGDVVEAHRSAAAFAHQRYRVRSMPEGTFDVVVLGAYPKDLEQYQLGNAFNALRSAGRDLLRSGGSLVIVARCPEGLGTHGLQGRGMRLHRNPVRRPMMEEGRELVIFSPGLTAPGLRASFHEGALHAGDANMLRDILARRHPADARVLVVPAAPLTILAPLAARVPQ